MKKVTELDKRIVFENVSPDFRQIYIFLRRCLYKNFFISVIYTSLHFSAEMKRSSYRHWTQS